MSPQATSDPAAPPDLRVAVPVRGTVDPRTVADPEPGPALGAYALNELRQAAALLDLPGDARHEGVHQARKSLRRARACLALRVRVDRRDPAALHAVAAIDLGLRSLCRGLSSVRDAQALCEALERLAPSVPKAAARRFARILALAEARRGRALAQALARDPGFARRRRRLLNLADALSALEWGALDARALERGLERSRRRVRKSGKHARAHAHDDAGWHRHRRRLRRLRQQYTAVAAIGLPLPGGRKALEAEAKRLGDAQDDALVLRACRRKGLFDPGQRALLRALARARLREARH